MGKIVIDNKADISDKKALLAVVGYLAELNNSQEDTIKIVENGNTYTVENV